MAFVARELEIRISKLDMAETAGWRLRAAIREGFILDGLPSCAQGLGRSLTRGINEQAAVETSYFEVFAVQTARSPLLHLRELPDLPLANRAELLSSLYENSIVCLLSHWIPSARAAGLRYLHHVSAGFSLSAFGSVPLTYSRSGRYFQMCLTDVDTREITEARAKVWRVLGLRAQLDA